MALIRCPYCGAASMEAAARDARSFVCQSCGRAVEGPTTGQRVIPPPAAGEIHDNRRWSDGPPAESADRWSSVPPLGDDDSSSNVSVSQSSILPREDAVEAPLVRPARSPLIWPLLVLALFLAALIGVVMLARSIKPWLDARRAAAEQRSVEHWLRRLDKGPDDARREAALAIVGLGPSAVVQTLDHISQDPGNGDRFLFLTAAVHALAAVGPDVAPGLYEGLQSSEPKIRAVSAVVVQEMGRPGRATRDALIAALDDENRWVRYEAIDALGSLGSDASPAAKRLVALAVLPDAFAARHAIDALGHIGPAAADVLPALETIAADNPDGVLRAAPPAR